MSLQIFRLLEVDGAVLEALKTHWDEKLSLSAKNLFPLAPRDLVKARLVTERSYAAENFAFGDFCSSMMIKELQALALDRKLMKACPCIEIFGPGLGRDLNWIHTAVPAGFQLKVRDISTQAIGNVSRNFNWFIMQDRIKIIAGDIADTLQEQEIDPRRTVAYFASQFLQVLKKNKMQSVSAQIGVLLTKWPREIKSKPRMYMVHPFHDDNNGPKSWLDNRLPSVRWGDTTPYTKVELCKAFETSLQGRKVTIEIIGKHRYFHQRYSFLKVQLKNS